MAKKLNDILEFWLFSTDHSLKLKPTLTQSHLMNTKKVLFSLSLSYIHNHSVALAPLDSLTFPICD